MPDHVTIRSATTTDATDIAALSDQLFQEDAGQRDPSMNLAWAREHGQGYFEQMITGERSICFVALAADDLIGYLAGYLHGPSDIRQVISAELESMFVLPTWRGAKVGAHLVDAFLGWARASGAVRISVTAYAANARAIAFYQHAGFQARSLVLDQDIA